MTAITTNIAKVIFDALPAADGRAFFAAFGDAVAEDGKDLSRVHWAWIAAELRVLPVTPPHIQAVTDIVIAGMELLASGKERPNAAAAAASAAIAAANAANADDAAAADAAAADAAAHKRQAATLLRLIADAPKGCAA